MLRLILIAGLVTLLSGCVRNVLFYDRASTATDMGGYLKAYVDGLGDVYSSSDIGLFYDQEQSQWLRCAHYPGSCKTKNSELEFYLNNDEAKDWRSLQNKRWSQIAHNILEATHADGSTSDRPIVFLIHGFRVPDATFEYQVAKQRINQLVGADIRPVFVEVHWDGRESGLMGAPNAWVQAQFSGPMVGLRLRYLFNEIDSLHRSRFGRPPVIRVLTHSSGAIVAGSLIGDAGGALPCFSVSRRAGQTPSCGAVYEEFYDKREQRHKPKTGVADYGVPQIPDLRLAMMAAATPSTTFTGAKGTEFEGDGIRTPLAETTLIIGHNNEDIALNKVVGRASLFGDSSLGKTVKAFCSIKKEFGADMDLYLVDMRRQGPRKRRKSHDFTAYLQDNGSKKMIELLFGVTRPHFAHESDFACPL